MKHSERIEDYLEHISEAIETATEYLRPFDTFDAFKQHRLAQDGIIRKIENIYGGVRRMVDKAYD